MERADYNSKAVNGKQDYIIPICIISLLFLPSFNFFLNGIIQTYFKGNSVSSFFYIFMAICGVCGYACLFIKKTPPISKLIIFLLLVGTFFIYQLQPSIRDILIDKELNPTTSQALKSTIYCIPAFILAICCSDWSLVLRLARFFSVLILALALICYIVCAKDPEYILSMYMPFSYNMLLCTCLLFGDGLLNGKTWETILGLFGAVFIALVGARGAFACVILFLILATWVSYKKREGKNYVFVLLFLLLMSGVAFLSNKVSLLREDGSLTSRVLNSFESKSFFESEGREEINEVLVASIKDHPILGLGLYGDRIAGAKRDFHIIYAHNILIEMLCSFGIVIGSLFFIILLSQLCKTINSGRISPYYILFISIIPGGFLQLFFSGSFLIEISFWVICGMLLNNFHSSSLEPRELFTDKVFTV